MRLLLLTNTFLPKIGGAELAIHNLAEGLISSGHQVMVCTSSKVTKSDFKHTYPIRHIFTSRGSFRFKFVDLWFSLFINFQIRSWKPDAIIANYAWPAGYAALKINNPKQIPTIIISHGADIQKNLSINYGLRLDDKLDQKIQWAICNADGLIAISKSIFEQYVSLGAPEKRIRLIPNGIDCYCLSKTQPDARIQLHLPPNKKVLLAVGRNHPKKRFKELINVMPELAKMNPDLLLMIVGKDVPKLQNNIEDLHLQNHVKLYDEALPAGVEWLNNKNQLPQSIITFYGAADLFLIPSLIEGLPLVGIEAMAAGLPIVASPGPGINDLIKEGINGVFASIDDKNTFFSAINSLFCDPLKQKTMGLNSRKLSMKYDRNIIAKEITSFISDL